MDYQQKLNTRKIITGSVLGLFALLVILSSFYSIKSTERGVLSTFGKISETPVSDGLHVKMFVITSSF